MSQGSIAEDLFQDADVSAKEWEQENESNSSGKTPGKLSFVQQFYLKDKEGENVGLISYLSDGINVQVHHVIDPSLKGGNVRVYVLCKRKDCELCYSGDEPKRQRVWPVVDWMHTFKSKQGIVRRPTFKLFVKGVETFKLHEERRRKFGFPTGEHDESGNEIKTLVGMKWEITRMGTGFKTKYDPLPADMGSIGGAPEKIDFTETEQIDGKDGAKIDIPKIAMPDWPDYQDKMSADMVSLYTAKQQRPDREIDWNNPEDANLFIKLHFMNTPQETYIRLGVPIQKAGKPQPAQDNNGHSSAQTDDDDIPF